MTLFEFMDGNLLPIYEKVKLSKRLSFEDGVTFTIELIQPHDHSWAYPED